MIISQFNPNESNAAAITWIDPHELLHPGRMDVIVKFLLARKLLGLPALHSGISLDDLYLRHILFRTGGAEPGDEARKGSLQDFVNHFIQLVLSMKQQGFNPEYPIPVSRRTGLILNGAHRLAVACALGIKVPVIYRDDVDGLRWDCDWFVQQGFLADEINEIMRIWLLLRGEKAGCMILWPTVEAYWPAMMKEITAVTPIASSWPLEYAPHVFAELVRDIYATDWGPVPGENIERKIAFFRDYAPRLQLLTVATNGPQQLIALKKELREKMNPIIPADYFSTLHTTDTARETAYIADVLLNPLNLKAIARRPANGFRPDFLAWLSQYFAKLQALHLDPEMCCVVGSGVLEAFGIRNATDIDFTITHAVREQFFTPGVTHINEDLDVVSKDYPRAILRQPAATDNDLIRDRGLHIRVRGLKFAALDVVLTRKQTQRRPKDLMDVKLATQMRLKGLL